MAQRHFAVERSALINDTKLDRMVALFVDHEHQMDRIDSLGGGRRLVTLSCEPALRTSTTKVTSVAF
jgi:hypothetical protein